MLGGHAQSESSSRRFSRGRAFRSVPSLFAAMPCIVTGRMLRRPERPIKTFAISGLNLLPLQQANSLRTSQSDRHLLQPQSEVMASSLSAEQRNWRQGGNLPSRQPIRIASPILSLVMMADAVTKSQNIHVYAGETLCTHLCRLFS